MVNLNDPKVMEEFCNNIVVAKLIADELGNSPSYEEVVNVADELNISPEDVYGYLRLYNYMSREMIL